MVSTKPARTSLKKIKGHGDQPNASLETLQPSEMHAVSPKQ